MTVRRVLVTGATGFVGPHVVRALQTRGASVDAFVRPSSRTEGLRTAGVGIHSGLLTDAVAFAEAARGADAVVHLAALTHARTEAELDATNRVGTAAAVQGAVAAGVPRFIYLSSLAAVGPNGGRPSDARTQPEPLTAYGRSKLGGEREVRSRSAELATLTLRAPAVYGPGDRELLRFFAAASKGLTIVPAGHPRPLQLVFVKDLADAIAVGALGEATGVFNVAEPRAYLWRDVCDMIGEAVGRELVRLRVPAWALKTAGIASEVVTGMLGRSTIFNRDKVRELLAPGWLCETESTRKTLGIGAATELEAGLRITAEWYRNERWL